MKSVASHTVAKFVPAKLPVLVQHDNMVILLYALSEKYPGSYCGICVADSCKYISVGFHSHFKVDSMTPYKGTVTLSND